jgi:hypothetical protein
VTLQSALATVHGGTPASGTPTRQATWEARFGHAVKGDYYRFSCSSGPYTRDCRGVAVGGQAAEDVFELEGLGVGKFPYGPDGTRLHAWFSAADPLRPIAGRSLIRAGGPVQLL